MHTRVNDVERAAEVIAKATALLIIEEALPWTQRRRRTGGGSPAGASKLPSQPTRHAPHDQRDDASG